MTELTYYYKFRKVNKYSLSALAGCQLWFDKLSNQNDPFEGECKIETSFNSNAEKMIGAILSKPNNEFYTHITNTTGIQHPQSYQPIELLEQYARSLAQKVVNDTQNKSFICSLSSSETDYLDPIRNTLMWGHYAEGLRGFCLVFDSQALTSDLFHASQKKAYPVAVKYSEAPAVFDATQLIKLDSFKLEPNAELNSIELLLKTSATKSLNWKLENEVRVLSFSTEQLLRFKPDSLEKVVFGEKMLKGDRELILSILNSRYPNTKTQTAKIKKDSYTLMFVDD